LRDYYSMPALAATHDAHLTINLTPVLLRQIDEYLAGATDVALELTRHAAEDLTRADVDEILATFFDADWHHQIFIHPRYRELFDQRTAGAPFATQDVRDLQMWFNLAWFGQEFRTAPVTLITGEVVTVHKLVEQGRGFTHDAVLAMIEDQYRILRAIVPIHRRLQEAGQIEVSTTPAYHPILPLLIDTDQAYVDRPGATLPRRYAHPEDAAMQISLAWDDYLARFGTAPRGMWPAEGAVSAAAVELLARHHLHWIATDGGVLARSGRWGYRTADADVLCQPYRPSDEHPLAVFFRDGPLSDAIAFRCGHFSDAREAAAYFMTELEERVLTRLTGDDDRIVTIVLDGENTWGGYADDGRPFLHALYDALTTDGRLKTVTFAEYLLGNAARRVPAHPPASLTRVHDLATGSWIDEPGSAHGVDLGTWIGEPEENAAWELLGAARAALQAGGPEAVSGRALDALLAAQGSDWYWWFGADQESRNDAEFDELFRAHLQAVYRRSVIDRRGDDVRGMALAPPDGTPEARS
jgi:alpha-amylase/alpha-mannosidase (GH57 family)